MASFDVDSWAKGRELSKRTRRILPLNLENLLIVGEISRRPDAEQLSDLSDEADTNSGPSCDSAPSSPGCLKEHMLSDDDRESITDNLTKLLRDLHCSEILDRLEEGGLITPYQREQIKNENTRYDTNRKFLNWVTTTPKETYIETKRAMRETNQGHLARLLEESAEKRRRKRKQGTQSQLPSGKTRKRSLEMRDVGVQQQQQATSSFTSVTKSFRFDFAAIRHLSDTQGYLHDVTPVKISKNDRKYFNAILQTDHTSYSEVVCYNAKQHAAFTESCETGTPVRLNNAIPLPRKSPKDTITIECGKKVKITEITTRLNFMKATPPIVITYLRDIKQRSEYQKVSVRVKVLEVDQHCQTFTTRRDEELKFQELIVADATAAIVLRIWEDQINRLKVGRSYRVLNVRVCHEGDIVFLGGNKETEIAKVRDIGKVVRFSDETLQHPRIIGTVTQIKVEERLVCGKCRKFVKADGTRRTLCCPSCEMKQRADSMGKAMQAEIQVTDDDGKKTLATAFESVITAFLELVTGSTANKTCEELEELFLDQDSLMFTINKVDRLISHIDTS